MSARTEGALAALVLVPVVCGSLWSLGSFARETFDVPRDEDYRQVAAALATSSFDPTQDVVSILPAWSLRPLKELKAYPWVSGDALDARPLDRYRDLYVVVEPDGEGPLAGLAARLGDPEVVAEAGPVRLLRYPTGGRTVIHDLTAHLDDVQARIEKGSEITPCDKKVPGGFGCEGRKSWQKVGRQRMLVTENGEEVLWVHPPPRGERLVLTWADVPLGERLVLRAGHARTGASWGQAAVKVRVLLDGRELATVVKEPAFDFRTYQLPIPGPPGRRGTLTFEVFTQDNGKNHFGIDAYTAGPAGRGAAGGAP